MTKHLTHFQRYVKNVAFFICILACAGCASKSATDSISESVTQQIVALKESLPPECQTKVIYSQISAIESGKNSMAQSCKADIAKVEAQRDKWMVAFFAIVAVLCGFAVKKFKII